MYKLRIRLQQHTPIIHFQGGQPGACLRASEVKTKLDRYLVMNFGSEFRNESGKFIEDYFVDRQHKALDYKMRISFSRILREEPPWKEKTNNSGKTKPYPTISSYFAPAAETDNSEREKKYKNVKLVVYEGVVLDLFSFCPGLVDIIKKHVPTFFAVTNFGARSSKGFGSFSVTSIDDTPVKETGKALLKGRTYIEFQFKKNLEGNKTIVEHVYALYQVLKSGINRGPDKKGNERYEPSFLIKKYMAPKGIGSEKAFIKKHILTEEELRRLSKRDQSFPHSEFKYVRAMLGVAPFVVFRMGRKESDEIKVRIYDESDKVKRFKSPITIKIFGNTAYFIAEKIPEAMYGREFTLTREEPAGEESEHGEESNRAQGSGENRSIKTPSRTEFDLEDLLCSFAREISSRKNQVDSVSVPNYQRALKDLVKVTFVKGESIR
ncbi:MAG TPA: hypothetical protein GXX39_00525 [Syntrophothermus lipocalidus]|nr:hypothetical protein [Syntrophothermus lipocalidus]